MTPLPNATKWVPAEEYEAISTRLHLAAILLDHSTQVKARAEETIARQTAMLDQRDAALEELQRQYDGMHREVERLRRVCREAGVDFTSPAHRVNW